jgi:anaerobic selenocysteine-containing dehydrogenase
MLAIRNTVKYSIPLFEKSRDALHDWEIFDRLITRIESLDPSRRASLPKRLLARWLNPRRSIGLGIRLGPYGAGWNPFSAKLTLRKIIANPQGIDLGPLQPCLIDRLQTPNRRIDLAPTALVADLVRLAPTEHPPAPGTLRLIGRRDLRTNNSWLHNSLRMVKGPKRCTLLIHPFDAASRGIVDGDSVKVRSRTGEVEITAETSEEIMQGVVSIPHGWGHHRPDIRLGIASAHAGVSVNDLTDDTYVDALCGNSALNGVAVTVTAKSAA